MLAILIPLFLIPVVIPFARADATTYNVPSSNTSGSPVYILSGDLIKDTQFASIGSMPIGPGGSAYDNKLKFEISNLWKIDKGSIELIYTHQVGNKVYLYYKIPLTADVNVYTNDRYADVCETQVQTTGTYPVFEYHHFGCYGDEFTAEAYKASIKSHSWDFGNVQDYVSKNDIYSGVVKIDFNLQSSPFPSSLTDENGNKLSKDFAYVGVSSAIVVKSDKGFMSQASPDIQYSVLQTDKSQELKSTDPPSPSVPSNIKTENTYSWNANPTLTDAGPQTTDNGIQMPSAGSSLSPTLIDGSAIYDAKENETSQPNCRLYYNLGSLSPVVTEYHSTLSYDTLKVITKDNILNWCLPKDTSYASHATKLLSSAIQVSNRYAHSQIQVVLNVWSAYDIQVLPTATSEQANLEKPVEYYDNLTWQSAVDGSASGQLNQSIAGFGGFDLDAFSKAMNGVFDLIGQALIYVIIIAIIVVAIYVTYRVLIARQIISTATTATRRRTIKS